MNHQLRAAAEYHTTFLNTLQTSILYDLCEQADEAGECKPDQRMMARRWRIHEKTVRWMFAELEVAGLIQKGGAKIYIQSAKLLKCPENCDCPISDNPPVWVPEPEAKEEKPAPKPRKKFNPLAVPDPGSLAGIFDKLKTHWRTRWKTAPYPGHIERALGVTVREILNDGGTNLNNFERAFINYLEACKDSESGKLSLKNFASTWGTWVNPAHKNTVHEDAAAMLKSALEGEL